jgi:hypothetical protein
MSQIYCLPGTWLPLRYFVTLLKGGVKNNDQTPKGMKVNQSIRMVLLSAKYLLRRKA